MNEKKVLSTVKYVAGTKPIFLLSEVAAYIEGQVTAGELYRIVSPELGRLGLTARKTGEDFEISRPALPRPYLLDRDEQERTEAFLAARSIPAALDREIGRYIAKKVGRAWTDPVILGRLRQAIVAQKDDYWRPSHKRSLQYTKGYSVLGYLAYHFPVYFMQARHLLALLAWDGLLKNEMNILDLGTGPGVIPLAIADFWRCLDGGRATVRTVERSREHIEAFTFLTERAVPDLAAVRILPPVEADITRPDLIQTGTSDLIVFSNVLNELAGLPLAERADLVLRYADHLSPDGTILIVEPAEEASSTGLRSLSLALKKRGLTVYTPCAYLWGTNCTPDRCWSFTTAPAIHPTRIMNALAACDEPFRYVNTDIKYSYVMLRKEGRTRYSCTVPKNTRAIRLSRIHLHAGKRVTVIAAKMSGDLGENETKIFKICDGSAEKPVYAVLPAFHITPANRELIAAPYGAVLEFRDVLAKYNPAHDAWNILVGRTSGITLLPNQGDPDGPGPGAIRHPNAGQHSRKNCDLSPVVKQP